MSFHLAASARDHAIRSGNQLWKDGDGTVGWALPRPSLDTEKLRLFAHFQAMLVSWVCTSEKGMFLLRPKAK